MWGVWRCGTIALPLLARRFCTDKALWVEAVSWWRNSSSFCHLWGHTVHVPIDIAQYIHRNAGQQFVPVLVILNVLFAHTWTFNISDRYHSIFELVKPISTWFLLIYASSIASFNILKVSLAALSNLKQTCSAYLFFKVSHFLKDGNWRGNNTQCHLTRHYCTGMNGATLDFCSFLPLQ